MFGNGSHWANDANGVTTTGLDNVDLWVGGLAEVTNLFGGLLGTTFNYVFQTPLENLQDGDRFYYLARTPGMNLRTQLEGNSFSELIQRNTDGTNTLKADAFATADCKFQLAHLEPGTPVAGFQPSSAAHRTGRSTTTRPRTATRTSCCCASRTARSSTARQHRRPARHQRAVRLQRHRRRRPHLRRQRQRHLLGWPGQRHHRGQRRRRRRPRRRRQRHPHRPRRCRRPQGRPRQRRHRRRSR